MYGFHHAILIRAGALRIPKTKFVNTDLVATLCWVLLVGGLGYFSSVSFSLLRHYLRYAEFGVIFVVIAYFVLDKEITEFLKNILK